MYYKVSIICRKLPNEVTSTWENKGREGYEMWNLMLDTFAGLTLPTLPLAL